MNPRRLISLAALIVVVALAVIPTLTQGADDATSPGAGTTVTAPADERDADFVADSVFSDLPPVETTRLPPEAIDTLSLIATDGPFPFDRDDLIFENREGLLPDRSIGHYREYTVITPGENDRGARRIVAGIDGELYYTADHYASFQEIVSE